MKKRFTSIAAFVLILAILSLWSPAFAQYSRKRAPDASRLGFGAGIDPWGKYVELSFNVAVNLKLDWVIVTFDWDKIWPESESLPDLEYLDQAMTLASERGLSVLMSLQNAPAWAMDSNGPDLELTASLVEQLASRYQSLKALELFSEVNTLDGWGTTPDPKAYADLFAFVNEKINQKDPQVILVAAGLLPLGTERDSEDIDDLVYLAELYNAGLAPIMPIISLRFQELDEDILQVSTTDDPCVLRRYEDLRDVMQREGHKEGIIWLTHVGLPATILNESGSKNILDFQAIWLQDAFQIASSQLYIGAIFISNLNPPQERENEPTSLILNDQALHPALESLVKFIQEQKGIQNSTSFSFGGVELKPLKRMYSHYKLIPKN